MIQVGDLIKHRHIGGLGLVMSMTTDTKRNHQAKIQWLINPYKGGGYTVLWTKLLERSETTNDK